MTRKVQTDQRGQETAALCLLGWWEKERSKERVEHLPEEGVFDAGPVYRGGCSLSLLVLLVLGLGVDLHGPEAALTAGWRRCKSCQLVSLSDVIGTGNSW